MIKTMRRNSSERAGFGAGAGAGSVARERTRGF